MRTLLVGLVILLLLASGSFAAACDSADRDCDSTSLLTTSLALETEEEKATSAVNVQSLFADVSLLDTNHELLGWTLYKQCDGRWGSHRLGTCNLTICQAGCAMSSVSMMLHTKGHGTDPGSLNTWLDKHGGYAGGCNIVWGSVNAFGVHFQGIENPSYEVTCAGLRAGHGIIANVHGGRHWVLLTGCRGNNEFSVNDPGFNTSTYSFHDVLHMAVYH